MQSIEEKLFDAYGTPIIEELAHFPNNELIDLLNSLPMEESSRVDFFDQARHYYFQWSVDAFSVGLHLGLSLLEDKVCRPGPKQG